MWSQRELEHFNSLSESQNLIWLQDVFLSLYYFFPDLRCDYAFPSVDLH